MVIAGLVIMSIGVLLTGTSVGLEIMLKQPHWMIFMKVGASMLAVGAVLFGIAI